MLGVTPLQVFAREAAATHRPFHRLFLAPSQQTSEHASFIVKRWVLKLGIHSQCLGIPEYSGSKEDFV